VEDNRDARESLSLLLELNDHEVTAVGSGREAIEAVDALRPDVVVCDIGLPDVSGLDVIRAIRAAHPTGGPYTVALTGFAQREDREQALLAGFDAHLAKPPRFEDLDELLLEVARRKRGRESAT
jgi:CheY-like chemotaxis protein